MGTTSADREEGEREKSYFLVPAVPTSASASSPQPHGNKYPRRRRTTADADV